MKIKQTIKNFAILGIVVALLSAATYGLNKITNVTDDITVTDTKECNTVFYTEEVDTYGNCTHTYDTTVCDDEPLNTSCHTEQQSYDYTCKTGANTVQKSKEECADKELQVTVTKPGSDDHYNLAYGDWGKCSYAPDGEEAVITCDSKYDGNSDGICQSGESCTQFKVSKDGLQKLIKNSEDNFVESDKSFFLEELNMEVLP